MSAPRSILDELQSFREDVIDRLARIERGSESVAGWVERHEAQDDRRFGEITQRLGAVDADLKKLGQAKALAERSGRNSGIRWGAIVAAIITAAAQVVPLLI